MSHRIPIEFTNLDVFGRNWLLNQRAEDLCTLLVVQMVEEEVAGNSRLQALELIGCFGEGRRSPVVIDIRHRLERLGGY